MEVYNTLYEYLEYKIKNNHQINWKHICTNSAIGMDFLEKHLDHIIKYMECKYYPVTGTIIIHDAPDESRKCFFETISRNESLTITFLEKYLDDKWDWYELSQNKAIPLDYIDKTAHIGKYKWVWSEVANHPLMTEEFVKKYKHKSLNFDFNFNTCLELHKCLSDRYVEENLSNKIKHGHSTLAQTRSITFLLRIPNIYYNDYQLALNENISLELIELIIQKNNFIENIFWENLSQNPIITPDFVEKYIDKQWSWKHLSTNPSITFEFIEKYHNKDWNWGLWGLSSQCIPLDFLVKFHFKPWYWQDLILNPSIPIEFIRLHPEYPWDINVMGWLPDTNFIKIKRKINEYIWDTNPDFFKGLESITHLKFVRIPNIPEIMDKYLCFHLRSLYGVGHWKVRITQEFKDELKLAVDEMNYRPGGSGFQECEEEFNSLVL